MDDENMIKIICYHCGNTGLQYIISEHKHIFGGPVLDSYGTQIDSELEEEFVWLLLSCPVCNNVTLFEKYTHQDNIDIYKNKVYDTSILYPQNRYESKNIPKDIVDTFELALKIKNIDASMCAISLRKTLELICKDKKAKGNTLYNMTANLVARNILPDSFNDACWVIRKIGNDAVHTRGSAIHKNDIEKLIDMINIIMIYLYEMPNKSISMRAKYNDKNENG